LLIDDDDVKVLIDPGAGLKTLTRLKREASIDLVMNTHYHFDHIAYNYLFDQARIIINEHEAPCYRDKKHLGSLLGMEEVYGPAWVDGWMDCQNSRSGNKTKPLFSSEQARVVVIRITGG